MEAHFVRLDPEAFSKAAQQLATLASSTAGSDTNRDEVSSSVTYLENVAATIRGTAHKTTTSSALVEMRSAILLRDLKSTKKFRDVVKRSISVVFPETELGEGVTAGQSKVRLAQFKLDIAYSLAHRDYLRRHGGSVRFGLVDSSPQRPYDWMLFKYKFILNKDLMRGAAAMLALTTSEGGALSSDDNFEPAIGIDEARADANAVLCDIYQEHLCVPSGDMPADTSTCTHASTRIRAYTTPRL